MNKIAMSPKANLWRNIILLGTGMTIILMPRKTPAQRGLAAALVLANVAITVDSGARTSQKTSV
jgi:hypothetical protein